METTEMTMEAMKKPSTNLGKRHQISMAEILPSDSDRPFFSQ